MNLLIVHSRGQRVIVAIILFSIIFFTSILFYAREEEQPTFFSHSLYLQGDILSFSSSVNTLNIQLDSFQWNNKIDFMVKNDLYLIDWGSEGDSFGWGPFNPVIFDLEPVYPLVVYDYEEYDGTLESREGREPLDFLGKGIETTQLQEKREDGTQRELVEKVDLADLVKPIRLVEYVEIEEEIEEKLQEKVHLEEKGEEKEEESIAFHLFTHRVEPGETLWSIARLYGVDVDTVTGANPQLTNANQLSIGQNIKILSQKGILHEVYRGETLWEISRIYNVSIEDLVKANNLSSEGIIRAGDSLFIPGASPLARPVRYMWPVDGPISSYFGPRWGRVHEGIDIVVPTGTSVRATRSGRVTVSGWVGAYGYVVYIDHGDGISSRYAHNSRLLVRPGDYVTQGQVIALSGSTGQSTGPHVHFEIRERGQAQNPLNYLQRR